MQTLDDYIEENFESSADFARTVEVFPQQISAWKRKGYMVHDGVLYRPMRDFGIEFEEVEEPATQTV